MISAIIRKVILTVPLLLLVSIVMFSVIFLLPGTAIDTILSEGGSVEQREELEAKYGYDLPIYVQYANWISGFVQGDMGKSILT